MTPYVQQILEDWKRHENAAGRRPLLATPKDTLPQETVKRIVSFFGFPKELEGYCLHFAEYFNLPELLSKETFEGIDAPNSDGLLVFQKEFELTQVLKITFEITLNKKPHGQEIERQHKKIKKRLEDSLRDIEATLKIADRHKKAILLSGFGERVFWLDKHLLDIINDLEKGSENIKNYTAYGSTTQVRNGAVLSLAYSYHYCFGLPPTSTREGYFYRYVEKLLERADMSLAPETIKEIVGAAIEQFKVPHG